MSLYLTEEQQLQSLKKWWINYQKPILISALLIIVILGSFKYFFWQKEKASNQASILYEQLIFAVSLHDNKRVIALANTITNNYPKTIYKDASLFILAKEYIVLSREDMKRNYYKRALNALQQIVLTSSKPAFQQVAKIRRAKILNYLKLYSQALEELDVIVDSSYLPSIEELQGDINYAQKRWKVAYSKYLQARGLCKKQNLQNAFLEMKIHELDFKIKAGLA